MIEHAAAGSRKTCDVQRVGLHERKRGRVQSGIERQPAGPRLSLRRSLARREVWLILLAFAAIHALFWYLQPDVAAKMVVGDRAGDRLRTLDRLLAATGFDSKMAVVFDSGSPGDYLLFAPAYALFGAPGIVAQALVLYGLALLTVHALATRLIGAPAAVIATVAWLLLPSTLFHPHALVTEAICNPLLVLLIAALVRLHDSDEARPATLMAAALLTALLVFVRHVFLLLPPAIAIWLAVFRPAGALGRDGTAPRPLLRYLAVSFSIAALWWVALTVGALRWTPGDSVGGLKSNLFLRAERMAYLGHVPLPASYLERNAAAGHDTRLLEPAEFIRYSLVHPWLFARTAAADAFNMMVNPGVAMLAGRYLSLFDLGERNHRDLNKWRETREKEGFLGLARLLLATSPTALAVNAIGVAAWVAFLAVAAFGAIVVLADATREPALRWLLAGLVLYVVGLTSLTAGYTRWDHRTPIDVALVLFFAAGSLGLAERHAGPRRLAA